MATFKAKKRSELVRAVPIQVGAGHFFTAFLRHVNLNEDRQLIAEHATPVLNKRTGEMEQRLLGRSADEYSLEYCRHAFGKTKDGKEGWEGMTPDIFGMLVELDDDSDRPDTVTVTQPDGSEREEIPFSMELAEFLWVNTRAESFADQIYRNSRQLLELAQAERDARRGN